MDTSGRSCNRARGWETLYTHSVQGLVTTGAGSTDTADDRCLHTIQRTLAGTQHKGCPGPEMVQDSTYARLRPGFACSSNEDMRLAGQQ